MTSVCDEGIHFGSQPLNPKSIQNKTRFEWHLVIQNNNDNNSGEIGYNTHKNSLNETPRNQSVAKLLHSQRRSWYGIYSKQTGELAIRS